MQTVTLPQLNERLKLLPPEKPAVVYDFVIRPNRIFTADSNIIQYRAGAVAPEKIREVIDRIIEIVNA